MNETESEPIEIPLKLKYTIHFTPKFGGKKRKASNEGKRGVSARRAQRCLVPGSSAARNARKGK